MSSRDRFAAEIAAPAESPAPRLSAEAFNAMLAEKRCALCARWPAPFGSAVCAMRGVAGRWLCGRCWRARA